MFRCHGQSCGDQIQLQITCPQRWCRSPMPARACVREHTQTQAACVTGSLQKVEQIKPTLSGCCHRYQSGFCPCMGSCARSIQRCGITPDLPSEPLGRTHIHRTVNIGALEVSYPVIAKPCGCWCAMVLAKPRPAAPSAGVCSKHWMAACPATTATHNTWMPCSNAI